MRTARRNRPYFSVKFNEPSRNGTPLKKIPERHVVGRTQWLMNANGREDEKGYREEKTRRKSDDIARRFTRTYANAAQRAHIVQLSNVYGYIQTL